MMAGTRWNRLGMFLCRHVPRGAAYRLAGLAAGAVCRLRPGVYDIVQANLGQVMGTEAPAELLAAKIRAVFELAIRNYYDLFRTLQLPREQVATAVDLPPEVDTIAQAVIHSGRGVVLVMPHLGNFDLMAQAFGRYASRIQVLSLPNPPPGFELINEVRRQSGVEVTPLGPGALKQALRLLRAGGLVGIAGDRPVSELDEPVPFFGRPARVPSGHVRLALKAEVPIVLGCCAYVPETRRYALYLEPPMELVRSGDDDEDVKTNVLRVLERLEAMIRRWPEQWQIFVPVWPELVETGG